MSVVGGDGGGDGDADGGGDGDADGGGDGDADGGGDGGGGDESVSSGGGGGEDAGDDGGDDGEATDESVFVPEMTTRITPADTPVTRANRPINSINPILRPLGFFSIMSFGSAFVKKGLISSRKCSF